ncbi:hypothetical protein LWI28_009251 [Acer negundo]|uniref:Uncharacterized protein n=1 Tax=Acer negundo TaxID=4023 RepID=A0AAD5IR19_ACENE|nr:hypothetical protein LWI28_009251 [Acer negundo]
MARVVEESVACGINLNNKDSSRDRDPSFKGIEVGVVLGVDFNGKEQEMIEIPVSRERVRGKAEELRFVVRSYIRNRDLQNPEQSMVFCNVYVANVENERKELWEFIVNIQAQSLILWVIGRDFNTILDPLKRRGGVCNMVSIRNFQAFLLQAKLVDVPLEGIRLTSSMGASSMGFLWPRIHMMAFPSASFIRSLISPMLVIHSIPLTNLNIVISLGLLI